jgi:hypothetical protein
VERFGIEPSGLERPAHLLLELIAHLGDRRLGLFAELVADPVAGLPLGDRLGLRLALGDLLGGDPADEPLAEAGVDPHAGDGRVGVGRGLDRRGGTLNSSRKIRRRASIAVTPRLLTVTGPCVPRVWEMFVAPRMMSKTAFSPDGTKSRRTLPVV